MTEPGTIEDSATAGMTSRTIVWYGVRPGSVTVRCRSTVRPAGLPKPVSSARSTRAWPGSICCTCWTGYGVMVAIELIIAVDAALALAM